MGEKKLEAEEFIYREGDTADAAYIVTSGKVELLETTDGKDTQAGVIVPGQAFGELAVFSPANPRSHSARAVEASVVESITLPEFQALLEQCPQMLQPFLKRAFERMKSTRVRVKASMADAVLETDISKITIAPATEQMKKLLKPVEVLVNRLPFRIGGYPESGEVSRRDQLHLPIPAQENPLRISRQHCEITIENRAIVITDLGSRFCTKVNDTVIGRGRGTYMAPLKKGANEIILGAVDGPYRLTMTCA